MHSIYIVSSNKGNKKTLNKALLCLTFIDELLNCCRTMNYI